MPDVPLNDPDFDELDDFDAAVRVGEKVLEMADRLKDVAAAMPGAQAKWNFTVENTRYHVVVTVAPEDAV